MIKKYIDSKLLKENALAGLGDQALGIGKYMAVMNAVNMGINPIVRGISSMIDKIKSIYNQNYYSNTECSGIAEPEERLKCELYNKVKISTIRINQLMALKSQTQDPQDLAEIDRHVQSEQTAILKYKSQIQ